jgi:hypothetical protein
MASAMFDTELWGNSSCSTIWILCHHIQKAGVRPVRGRPLSSGGVGRTLPVSLILSSRRNTLLSGWRHAGYLSAEALATA